MNIIVKIKCDITICIIIFLENITNVYTKTSRSTSLRNAPGHDAIY